MSSRFSIQNFPAFGMEMTYFSETTEFCTLSAAMIVIQRENHGASRDEGQARGYPVRHERPVAAVKGALRPARSSSASSWRRTASAGGETEEREGESSRAREREREGGRGRIGALNQQQAPLRPALGKPPSDPPRRHHRAATHSRVIDRERERERERS